MVSPEMLDRDMSPSPDSDENDSSHEQTSSLASTVQSAKQEESPAPSKVSKFVGVVIPPPPAAPALPIASSQSGIVYDPRMRFHTEKDIEEDEDIHPEDPRRIWEIFTELKNAGLVEDDGVETDKQLVPFKLYRINARFAEPAEICLVHSQRHFDWMAGLAGKLCVPKSFTYALTFV
jgi:histone deacetylase 6